MGIRKFYLGSKRDGYPFDRIKRLSFTYGFDIRAGGIRYQERGYLTKSLAEDAMAAIKSKAKAVRHGISAAEPTSPYLADLLQKKLNSMDGKERVRAKRVFNVMLKLVPDRKVVDIRSADIEKYVERRKADGVSAATIRRELVPVLAALNTAGKYFESLESYRPPKISRPAVSRDRKTRTLTASERISIVKFLKAEREANENLKTYRHRLEVADFFEFVFLSVSRPGEVAQLTSANIDMAAGIVEIKQPKTKGTSGITKYQPITDAMKAILERRMADSFASGFLFAQNGQVTPGMREHLKRACEASGIKYGRNEPGGVTFRNLRHTAITELLRNGIDIKTVAALAGHSDTGMTMQYAQVSPEYLRFGLESLGRVFDTGGEKVTSKKRKAAHKTA